MLYCPECGQELQDDDTCRNGCTSPDTLSDAELVSLLDEIDAKLPPCDDNAYQMIAYCRPDDLLQPIKQGKLVVISRGMLRRIRSAIARR